MVMMSCNGAQETGLINSGGILYDLVGDYYYYHNTYVSTNRLGMILRDFHNINTAYISE